jgi:hypothetical protein
MARKFSFSIDDGTRRRRRRSNKGVLGSLYELLGLFVSIRNIFRRSFRFINRTKAATSGGSTAKKKTTTKTTTTAKAKSAKASKSGE